MTEYKNGVRFFSGTVQGYGAPGYQWIQVVFDNRLLESKRFHSPEDFGRGQLLLEQKWKRRSRTAVAKIAARKTRASPVCSHCKRGTIYFGGSVSIDIPSRYFCHDTPMCQEALEAHRQKLIAARNEREKKDAEEQEAWRRRRNFIAWPAREQP